MNIMIEGNLSMLADGLPGVSESTGGYLAEGAAYCLEANCHQNGVILEIKGSFESLLKIYWDTPMDENVLRSWNDSYEATEFGAAAIAIIIVKLLTNYTVIERSSRGTGFDYWLGADVYDENLLPFTNRKAKLEVSGIWNEKGSNTITARINQKLKQTGKFDQSPFPVFIIVVEFRTPKAKFIKK